MLELAAKGGGIARNRRRIGRQRGRFRGGYGRGFYGATNDKVVTDAGFILIVFFPLFVLFMSLLQKHLEKRKEARISAHKAHATDAQWRGGW